MSTRRAAMSLAGLALVLLSYGRAGAVVLRYNPKPGTVCKYKESVKGAGEFSLPLAPEPLRMQMEQTSLSSVKVLSCSEEAVEIEYTVLSGSVAMTVAEEQAEKLKLPKTSLVYRLTPRGKLLETRVVEGGKEPRPHPFVEFMSFMPSGDLEALSFVPFPEADIAPGGKWTDTIRLPLEEGSEQALQATVSSELLGLLTYRGRPCAKIRTSIEVPIPIAEWMKEGAAAGEEVPLELEAEAKASMSFTWYFDHEQGMEVASEGTMVMLMKMAMSEAEEGLPMSMSSTMKMNFKSTLVEK